MPSDGSPPRLPTAVGPDLAYLRTVISSDGSVTRIPDVELAGAEVRPALDEEGLELPEGLEYEGVLGRGAMGEVHRVRDTRLNRCVAMKILKWTFHHRPVSVQRFLDEAQATAQLQHPGIVPVHDMGVLPDGRVFFTMQEVVGRTLSEVVTELHAASSPEGWGTGANGTTLRRLIEYLRTASEAVAYAHARGVVHRDLKPDNIMVGPHAEVLVMDWGIAKVLGRADLPVEDAIELTGRTESTRVGTVFGTPAYMAPEQASGRTDEVDARTDVYALGCVLFAMLYGERPYRALSSRTLISRVASCIPPGIPTRPRPPVPPELERIRSRAMAADPEARFEDAGSLAAAIVAWLDGSARRQRALELVDRAHRSAPRVRSLRAEAEQQRREARRALSQIEAWRPESDKRAAWRVLERASGLDAEADLLDVEVERLLQGALAHDGDCVEARAALAERWHETHVAAERDRDPQAARRAEAQLRGHLESLPPGHGTRTGLERYLNGRATVSLVTEPPGVSVRLERFQSRGRRLVAVPERSLGTTPLLDVDVEHGSAVLVIDERIRMPVRLDRLEQYAVIDPEGRERPLRIPRQLGANECFVPLGWAWLGGDPSAIGSAPRHRVWTESFIIQRVPVSNREYREFLNDLVERGEEEAACRYVPREKGGTVGSQGAMIYGRDADGRFYLRPDADGDDWSPTQAVACVTWHGARAYAAWFAERTGQPWRLPTSVEWEKAGRGVDERIYPWGDEHDPSWSCMRDSHAGRPAIADVDGFPVDESPYGVRGLAGNVRDWCEDGVADGRKIDRGGFWLGNAREARLADQHEHVPDHRAAEIGFRLARPVGGP